MGYKRFTTHTVSVLSQSVATTDADISGSLNALSSSFSSSQASLSSSFTASLSTLSSSFTSSLSSLSSSFSSSLSSLSSSVASSISSITGSGGGGGSYSSTILVPLGQAMSGRYLHHSYQYIGQTATIDEIKFVQAGVRRNNSGSAFTSSVGGFTVSYYDEGLGETVITNDPILLYVRKNSFTGSSILQNDYNIRSGSYNSINNVPLSPTSSNLNISSSDSIFVGLECEAIDSDPSLSASPIANTSYIIIKYTAS
jgi:hypothetical protein